MDVYGQNAVRFVPTRTGMCGLPDRGGRGGEIFRTIKPSPLALPLNFASCALVRQPGRGRECDVSARRIMRFCSNPHKNVRATRLRWERRGNFPDYEALTPGPPPEICIVCFVRQPGRGKVVDVCGQNAVRFVPTRTGMCGLPDRGGRGGEIFRTMKPSPLALPLNFASCVLSGNRAGGG